MIVTYSEKSNESNAKQRQSNSLYYLYISIYKGYSTSVALLLKKSVFPYNNGDIRKTATIKLSQMTMKRERVFIYTQILSNRSNVMKKVAIKAAHERKTPLLSRCFALLSLLKERRKLALNFLRSESGEKSDDIKNNRIT